MEKHGITSLDDLVTKKIPTRFATLKTGTGSEFIVNGVFKAGFGIADYRKELKDWGGSVEYASYSAALTFSLTTTSMSSPSPWARSLPS